MRRSMVSCPWVGNLLLPHVPSAPIFLLILFLFSLALVSPAAAIVTDDVVTSEQAPSGAWAMNWDYVYNYKYSSAVAIDPYWLLTVSHVADDASSWSMTLGGTTYTEMDVVHHKNTLSQDPDHSVKSDLALVRLDTPLPGYYDLYSGSYSSDPTALVVGYGNKGTVSMFSYTQTLGTNGVKRWGTNIIEREQLNQTVAGFTSDLLSMDYRKIDSPYEAGFAFHDSGGGTFVEDTDGEWKLAGINAYVYETVGGDYNSMASISTKQYLDWIGNVMDDPTYLPSILGDANKDWVVDVSDLGILATNYGMTSGAVWEQGDFNLDGKVDVSDLGILSSNYGTTAGGQAVMAPEPAAMSLLGVGALVLLRRRK